MRGYKLQRVSEHHWDISKGEKVIATFSCEHPEELTALSHYLGILYPTHSEIAVTVDLDPVEIEVPSRHNRSDNPQDPANSYQCVTVDEEDMESALSTLVQRYEDEFNTLCEEAYLGRMGEV